MTAESLTFHYGAHRFSESRGPSIVFFAVQVPNDGRPMADLEEDADRKALKEAARQLDTGTDDIEVLRR